jgi:phytoene dehydrogenase-like protein
VKVALFDAHYVAGGCATQFVRGTPEGRYRFDVGLHYVGDCGPSGAIPSILRELGIDLEFEPLDPDGFDELIIGDFRFRIPVGLDLYRDRLVSAFPSERKGIDRYCEFVRQVDQVGRRSDAQRGKLSAGLALHMLLHGRLLGRFHQATIGEFLDTCTKDPLLRAVILGQHGDYGLPPSEVSAVLHAGLANHYFQGAHYPRGGGQIIADKIAQVIENNGGTIHLRRPIERIVIEDGRAVGVLTEERRGERHLVRAKAVLSNADLPKTVAELVGLEHFDAAFRRRAERWKMGAGLFMVFLGVKADLAALGMGSRNYWLFDGTDVDALYADTRAPGAPVNRGAYITSATLKDPKNPHHAPPGIHTVEVMSIASGKADSWGTTHLGAVSWDYKRSPEYAAHKHRIEEELIARFDAIFPGVASAITYRESASPLSHSRFTRATDGTGYGLAATPDQFMQNRPGYRSPLAGLYFCGASTRAGHGIVGAMMSGRAAAHCVSSDRKGHR